MMEQMIKVPGLDGNKMGKSDNNSIEIGAPMNIIGKLYMKKGITDPERKHLMDLGDPYNRCKSVYGIHELITQDEKDLRVIANKCMKAEISCVECKKILVESIAKILIPFQEKRKELPAHRGGRKGALLRDEWEDGSAYRARISFKAMARRDSD